MKTVAIIEDNPDNRLLVEVILEDQYHVLSYTCGRDALEKLQSDSPDLILMDISLPEMDGTEVLQKVRAIERFKKIPVIALTAHAMAHDRQKYLGLGFNDYLAKPIVDEDALLEAIERQINPSKISK